MSQTNHCKCGSPICGKCGQCIEERHPKRADGSIIQFGADCPFPEAERPGENAFWAEDARKDDAEHADHWPVHILIEHMHNLDNRIADDFLKRRGRRPELADKVKKVIEEVGEVIHTNVDTRSIAINRHELLAVEVWDSAFAAIAQGFNLGLSNEQMMEGLNKVLGKLRERWIPDGFTQ